MEGYQRSSGFADRRGSQPQDLPLNANPLLRMDKLSQQRLPPRGPPTPSMGTPAANFDQPLDQQQVTGSPPPPPTPAASPGPSQPQAEWDAEISQDLLMARTRQYFKSCNSRQRTRILADLLTMCTAQQLSFVHQFVSPLLKKDPFTSLPEELCLRVCSLHSIPLLQVAQPLFSDFRLCRYCPSSTTLKSLLARPRCQGDGVTF